ncbi:hypothetical protein LAZ67_12000054 [Cordylochernes scorpioides]|uniref:Transposase n=1 Tax=Cordylochernes scorpioides TaxID=51811 RepID=A0ABY6L082_9ARAC|nr:hypothetical protein LAZ67_12000054 [Cordylochernes scorpioides]
MPRLFTKDMKEKRRNACKELLKRYEIQGERSFDRMTSQSKGCILENYLPKGQTVNSIVYYEILEKKLKSRIRSKKRGLLKNGDCLQHDNAWPHVDNLTIENINKLNF